MNEPTCCSRCGHLNVLQAKYCAHCGLRLPAGDAGATCGDAARPQRCTHRRLIIVLSLLVIALATVITIILRRG